MNTQFFKYAIEIEQTRSISQAAQNLFMAQPNLSKAIKELEDSLGYSIFERTSKGVIPTIEGNEFLVYAKNIVSQLSKMEEINSQKDVCMQSFNISMPRGSYIANAFTNFVSELDKNKPISVNVLETNSMQTINNVSDGHFHMGIVRYQNAYEQYFLDFLKNRKLDFQPVWEFEYLVLMSADNKLAKKEKVLKEDLKKCIEIVHGDLSIPYISNSNSGKISDNSFVKKKIYVYERCNQFDLLSRIDSTFMWVSPIPKNLITMYNLVQRKCDVSSNKYKDIIVYPKNYKFNKLDKKFIDKLFNSKNEVSFENYN